jgi:hypothetical protein
MIPEADFRAAADGVCPGPDLEWFGVDADGHVAGFTNAGFALVPAAVFDSYSLYNRTLEIIDSLPRRGRAEWIAVRPPCGDTWDDWSVRGLFAYDWNWNSGIAVPTLPYRQVCRPTVPLHVSELPADIAGYIGLAAFTSLRFPDTDKIDQGLTPSTLRRVGSVPADRYRAPYGPGIAARLESFAVGLSRDYTLVHNLSATESRALVEYLLELACKCQNERNIQLGHAVFCELPRTWSLQYLATCAAPIAAGDDDWEYRRLLELLQEIDHETFVRFAQIGKQSLNAEIREAAEDFCPDRQSP